MALFLKIALVVISIILIVSIIMQPSKSQGLNSIISGGNENYFSKNKVKTREKTLEKVTSVSAFLFAVIVLLMHRYS
ncbi:preprotein translocase subunit SecG [Hathewaya proteolytica DSM 3090]|uniref:Protein-export membrane protein SecG n=1 Tax=Hathewaya proteolytica DSM 3090 TaxID=1121331 RepID=A0A1M6NTM6_9CLOT|nr:preprotein translocase subunit SecG [Hathewaya proteolytica]SHJ99083.1 preprotein translocase subunit SecG [Hathewaya proteolytica DSM 3090]